MPNLEHSMMFELFCYPMLSGFQMLQKLGWTEGQGLGVDGGGILNPINKFVILTLICRIHSVKWYFYYFFSRATQRDSNQGLGTTSSATPEAGDNEYDAYRKRMMLAYRFRPNPLVNCPFHFCF